MTMESKFLGNSDIVPANENVSGKNGLLFGRAQHFSQFSVLP